MGDVQLVTTTRISKTSLTLGRGSPRQESPTFTLPPRNARVSPGGTARLDGKVRGHPEPQVTWSRNGKVVIAGERFAMEQSSRGTFSLVVHGVQEEDAGRYTCEAVNDAGSRQVTVEITVEGTAAPKFRSVWSSSSGEQAQYLGGEPPQGDEELHASPHFNMYEKSGIHFLEIRDVCVDDAGMYTCSVANSAGKATATAELIVQGRTLQPITQPVIQPSAVNPQATTDSPEVKPTSNGLLADKRSPTKTGDRAETRLTALTRETKDSIETKTPAWKTSAESPKTTVVTSPKPPADLPDKAPRQPGVSPLKVASSTTTRQHHLRGQGAARTSPPPQSRAPERDTRDTVKTPPKGVPDPSPEPTRETRRQARESRSERAAVTAGAQPKFDSVPQSQDATEGTQVIFKCQGSPVPGLSWVKDGLPLRPRAGLTFQQDGNTHIVTLTNVQKRDNSRLEGKPPAFSTVLKGCSVSEGQDFLLQCS
ncbi:unnamed protein product, partial [Coregonus sp. 'balchen']